MKSAEHKVFDSLLWTYLAADVPFDWRPLKESQVISWRDGFRFSFSNTSFILKNVHGQKYVVDALFDYDVASIADAARSYAAKVSSSLVSGAPKGFFRPSLSYVLENAYVAGSDFFTRIVAYNAIDFQSHEGVIAHLGGLRQLYDSVALEDRLSDFLLNTHMPSSADEFYHLKKFQN